MKIQYVKCYNQKFGNNYYSTNYVVSQRRPTEVDIVEETVKQYVQSGEKVNLFQVFYQIGKIFEEHTSYEKAIEFYCKAKNSLNPNAKSYKTKAESIDFDIRRVFNKKSQFNDK